MPPSDRRRRRNKGAPARCFALRATTCSDRTRRHRSRLICAPVLSASLDRQVERETFTLELPADGVVRYTRVARIRFMARGQPAELSAFWIEGYGGGLFVPFRDATSGATTYGGGRYLYDTIKGADLGAGAERIVLDFNYAYNPSCAYNDEWVCPLSPPENRLLFAVEAGEKV